MSDESCSSLDEDNDNSNNMPAECTDERAIEEVEKLNTCVKESLETSSYNKIVDEAQYNFNSITLLENLQGELSECNTQFISDYLKVLISNDKTNISCVTDNIMTSIEQIVVRLREEQRLISESDMTVLVCWLCAAVLWDKPHVVGAHAALHSLLPFLTGQEAGRINQVWQRCASPPARLALSDVVRRATPSPAPALALALLGEEMGEGSSLLAVRWYARQLLGGRNVHFSDGNNHTNIQKQHAILKVKQIILE